MTIKSFFFTLFLCVSLSVTGATLSGCSAGGHIGPVGGAASVG
jgi:hypothetical protein